MLLLVQTVSAIIGAGIVALLFAEGEPPPPWFVYVVAAGASGWAGTWLYARWRYGKGVTVTPSRPDE